MVPSIKIFNKNIRFLDKYRDNIYGKKHGGNSGRNARQREL